MTWKIQDWVQVRGFLCAVIIDGSVIAEFHIIINEKEIAEFVTD
jgi:hypothetical protein